MELADARNMLAGGAFGATGVSTWADLGCGAGTFTRALAETLTPGSTIHAIDRDHRALSKLPAVHNGVRIVSHLGDFVRDAWAFAAVNGILLANSLHYVRHQAHFLQSCRQRMTADAYFLIVEYDTTNANRWVPYPVARAQLPTLFERAGLVALTVLGERPSLYQRAPLYSALITVAGGRESSTGGRDS